MPRYDCDSMNCRRIKLSIVAPSIDDPLFLPCPLVLPRCRLVGALGVLQDAETSLPLGASPLASSGSIWTWLHVAEVLCDGNNPSTQSHCSLKRRADRIHGYGVCVTVLLLFFYMNDSVCPYEWAAIDCASCDRRCAPYPRKDIRVWLKRCVRGTCFSSLNEYMNFKHTLLRIVISEVRWMARQLKVQLIYMFFVADDVRNHIRQRWNLCLWDVENRKR